MSMVFPREYDSYVMQYVDDIVIYSNSFEEHLQHIETVFNRLRECGITLNGKKCQFAVPEITFLGHRLSSSGIKMTHDLIDEIRKFPIPRNIKKLRGFLGALGYYRDFLPNYSRLMYSYCQLLKKGVQWKWQEEHYQLLEKVKGMLLMDMELANPNFNTPLIIYTNASREGIGGAICQRKEGQGERVISFASRTLNDHERMYTTSELECMAIIFMVKKFNVFLLGRPLSSFFI